MADYKNPFEYEAANKLSASQINQYYIEEFNYSRFVKSKRNVFFVGERGSGKTMILKYYSLPVEIERLSTSGVSEILDKGIIPIYVTCNTPLAYKQEYKLLGELRGALLSEHFLVASIMFALIEDIKLLRSRINSEELDTLKSDYQYIFEKELSNDTDTLNSIQMALQKSNLEVQALINSNNDEKGLSWLFGFNSGLLQLIALITKIRVFNNIHFSFMIDDAHLLNEFQIRILNSWVSFRDNSAFSFKLAKTKVDKTTMVTATGGSILEGHDYTEVDLEAAYQNRASQFGRYSRMILRKRLQTIDLHNIELEDFFPEHPQFVKDKEQAKLEARKIAEDRFKGKNASKKQIEDYVYKMARAFYFRNRPNKANIPPAYTGLETIIHMSTGIVRNLLHPCYYMYEDQYSTLVAKDNNTGTEVKFIEPKIQLESILKRSAKAWLDLEYNLPDIVEGCSKDDALHTYQLMNQLSILFRYRLLNHNSEPRAISFTISESRSAHYEDILGLINIARKAQLLYVYLSSAKDKGQREYYYILNRILCPQRQLDPIGQHARVSLKASVLYEAANSNKAIPYQVEEVKRNEPNLFPR